MTNTSDYFKVAVEAEGPLSFISFPHVDNAGNVLNATGASDAQGGTISFLAGIQLTLGNEIVSGTTGNILSFITSAFTSVSLDVSSTYYLRAQVNSLGEFVPYMQKGTDTDTIPASLKGTPGGGSGGGFDSTVLDMLIARVVTGTATTIPVVTNLANARVLRIFDDLLFNIPKNSSPTSGAVFIQNNLTLNWSRIPKITGVQAHCGSGTVMEGPTNYFDPSFPGLTDGDATFSPVYSRYTFGPVHAFNAYQLATFYPSCNCQRTYEVVA